MGAWIETVTFTLSLLVFDLSHPVWVRGLKPHCIFYLQMHLCVAPRVGAWIETTLTDFLERNATVAPRVGAWIETFNYTNKNKARLCRTPCGCVD